MTPPNQNDIGVVANSKIYYSNTANSLRERSAYIVIKRMMDIVASASGLILLAPLFLVLSIIIKLEDPKGSIFFSQVRIGKNEKPFRMYKFRSMVHNAEDLLADLLNQNEISGAMFKMKEDPRVTKVGKFIRKTSIDELPQLINVLIGDMSMVGPRPPLEREVAQYTEQDKLRLSVIPGCTGLWQVSGRNELSFSQMVELDIEYIAKRSIWGDIKIILKTVTLLFGAKDAY